MPPISAKSDDKKLQSQLSDLAREIVSDLSDLEPARSKELLSDFVSELFLSMAQQNQREERRQRQAEGIAAARARGVRFGRPAPPLPDNFEEVHQAWRDGEISLRQAAKACGMPTSTFHGAAVRREQVV